MYLEHFQNLTPCCWPGPTIHRFSRRDTKTSKISKSRASELTPQKYLLLTRNGNETIRYYYSRSEKLNLSIFNLDSHILLLKIIYQTPEIQACKVKIYSAPETRGFVKGPSPDLMSQAHCKRMRTLTFSFFF